nr:alkaline phosphatase family protein [Bacillus sp. REN3]
MAVKKRVILLLLDSLMEAPLKNAMKQEQANTFQYFIENGHLYPDIISSFPTMSVNVDSTILTGVYCDQHKVPGLVWYHQDEKRLINYGSHIREWMKLGLNQSLKDVLYNLNNCHLNGEYKTIHEELADIGKQSASINTLMYRGSSNHRLKIPFLLSLLTGFPKSLEVKSARFFSYGLMSKIGSGNRFGNVFGRYGFQNAFSVKELIHLIKEDKLPDFSIVYFPDGDKSVHKNGPSDIKGIKKVDKQLAEILDNFNTWEEAIKQNIWVLLGDNGQARIGPNREEALIDLRTILGAYQIAGLKKGVTTEDQIVLAVNERMAYIYSLDPIRFQLSAIAKTVQKDRRIDLIAWKEGGDIHIISGIIDGKLIFRKSGDFIDEYGQMWSIEGSQEILDMDLEGDTICYGDYPDGLARIYSSLFSHQGDYLVVTARPGYEMIGEGSPTHVGGASHGALHKQDSLVPMIVTGTDSAPKHSRMKDLKEWLMSIIINEAAE